MSIEVYKELLKEYITKDANINVILKEVDNAIERELIKNTTLDKESIKNEIVYQVYHDIKSGKKLVDIQKQLRTNKILWHHNVYEKLYYEELEEDGFIVKPFEVEEGVLECKCGSKRVYSYQKQSRGSDEPMSTYAQCMACRTKWVYSG